MVNIYSERGMNNMFEKGLREEFDAWLENREWTEEEFKQVDNLTKEDKDDIVDKVLNDEQLTQEMFNCFEWYLNKYLVVKENK
jgi:hypothetical protein